MNIALMSHDNKKELMVQFCTAYAGILGKYRFSQILAATLLPRK